MRIRHFLVLGLVCLLPACEPASITSGAETVEAQATVSANDFMPLVGDDWSGMLTYLNYGSDQTSAIPVRMILKTPEGSDIPFAIKYPGEEDANVSGKMIIAKDGTVLDKKTIIENTVLANGVRKIVAQGSGQDDNRPADIQIIYEISDNLFKMRKMVRFKDISEGDDWFQRNEYVLKR